MTVTALARGGNASSSTRAGPGGSGGVASLGVVAGDSLGGGDVSVRGEAVGGNGGGTGLSSIFDAAPGASVRLVDALDGATAGALEYPRWKFLLTVMIARSFRYYLEGILAVYYGRRVLLFMKDNGLVIVSIAGSLALIGLIIYFIVRQRRNSRAPVDAGAEEASD